MSSSAYCRSVLYPLLFRVFTILSPSAIQRADDFVGIEMPIVPLSSAKACGVIDIRPRANVIKINLNDFIFFFGGRKRHGGRTRDRSRDDRRLNLLRKRKFSFLACYRGNWIEGCRRHRSRRTSVPGKQGGSRERSQWEALHCILGKKRKLQPALHSLRKV